jgi:alkanesulfonate monooxygenase SsuD/methylene tetrahydromethanopterin reductase-like flavin-dependent oxidoreductase (luciferase family)
MQLGYFNMPLHPPGSHPADTMEADLRQLEVLDRLGYREAWIGEHFTSVWENIPAPDQFIAAALSRTSNIILGTGVTCMPNHDPFMIAHRIAQLDNLARGRFHWGVGSGGFPGDFEAFGVDPSTGAHRCPPGPVPRLHRADPQDVGRPEARRLRTPLLEILHPPAGA